MRQGAPRAEANRIATAAMDREYARPDSDTARKTDPDAHDSRTGQRKTNLTTKKGSAVSGANKPSAAKKASAAKRGAGSTHKPRASTTPAVAQPSTKKSAAATRLPPPAKAAGTTVQSTAKNPGASTSQASERENSKRTPRSMGTGGAGSARKPPLQGRASAGKKSSGVSRVG